MAISGIQFALTVAVLGVLLNSGCVQSSADIMRDIAKGFYKALEECKKELANEDTIMVDLYHFWKEEYDKVGRDVGCTIICMSKKLDLFGGDSKLHHENAESFAKKHGADDQMAKKLVEVIHACEKDKNDIEDECVRVLEVAKCFRTKISELSWTPSVQDVLGEVIIDIE